MSCRNITQQLKNEQTH